MTEDASKRCIHCIHYANGKCYNHSAVRDGKSPRQYVNDAPRDIPDPGNTPEWCPRDDGTVTMYDFIHPVASSCKGCGGYWPFDTTYEETYMGGGRTKSCGRYVIYPTEETDRVCPFFNPERFPNEKPFKISAESPAVTKEMAELIVSGIEEKNPLYWSWSYTDYNYVAKLNYPGCRNFSISYHKDDTAVIHIYQGIGGNYVRTSRTCITSARIDNSVLVMNDGKRNGNEVRIPIVEMTVEKDPLEEEDYAECPAQKSKTQTLDKWGAEI